MKVTETKVPNSPTMLKQVSLEPEDLARYNELLAEHLRWLAIAQDFVPQSDHLKQITARFAKMKKEIEELIHYGVPTEIEQEGN